MAISCHGTFDCEPAIIIHSVWTSNFRQTWRECVLGTGSGGVIRPDKWDIFDKRAHDQSAGILSHRQIDCLNELKAKNTMNNQPGLLKAAVILAGILSVLAPVGQTKGATITVNADQVLHTNSPYLTGACLEDVNHEIYGGIDSQMIFGESFAEPAAQLPLKGFKTYEGRWTLADAGSVQGAGSDGSKIVWDGPALSVGEVSVDVKLTEATGGNEGLILKVNNAGIGADAFTGYEVSLERPGQLVVGRHRQNWEPIRNVACDVPVKEWIKLTVNGG